MTVAPTGTVQFEINGTNFGSAVALSGGSATSGNLRKYLPTGTYVVTAVYSGSTNFNPSTGTLNGGQVVNLAARYGLREGLDLTCTAHNLLDAAQKFPDTFGLVPGDFPWEGRALEAGVRWQF